MSYENKQTFWETNKQTFLGKVNILENKQTNKPKKGENVL